MDGQAKQGGGRLARVPRPVRWVVMVVLVTILAASPVYAGHLTVKASDIVNNAIRPKHINNDAVRPKHINDNAVRARHIRAGHVRTQHIQDENVTNPKLGDGAVDTDKLADFSVRAPKTGPFVRVVEQATINNGFIDEVTSDCPAGGKALSGGYRHGDTTGVYVLRNAADGFTTVLGVDLNPTAWTVRAWNASGANVILTVDVVCLIA